MTARSLTAPPRKMILWTGIGIFALAASIALAQGISRDSYFTLTEDGAYYYTQRFDPAVTYNPGEVAIHVIAFGDWDAEADGNVLGDVTFVGTYQDGELRYGTDVCGFYPAVPYPNIAVLYAIPASACSVL